MFPWRSGNNCMYLYTHVLYCTVLYLYLYLIFCKLFLVLVFFKSILKFVNAIVNVLDPNTYFNIYANQNVTIKLNCFKPTVGCYSNGILCIYSGTSLNGLSVQRSPLL